MRLKSPSTTISQRRARRSACRSRFSRRRLPSLPYRVGLGVEDDCFEIQCLRGREQKVEVFQGLCEDEALHLVFFLFGDDALERGVARFSPARFNEVVEESLAHAKVLRVAREVVEVVS